MLINSGLPDNLYQTLSEFIPLQPIAEGDRIWRNYDGHWKTVNLSNSLV